MDMQVGLSEKTAETHLPLEAQLRRTLKNSDWETGIVLNDLLKSLRITNNTKAISILRTAPWVRYEFKRCWYIPTPDEIIEREKETAAQSTIVEEREEKTAEMPQSAETQATGKLNSEKKAPASPAPSPKLDQRIQSILKAHPSGLTMAQLNNVAQTSWELKQIPQILQRVDWAITRGKKVYYSESEKNEPASAVKAEAIAPASVPAATSESITAKTPEPTQKNAKTPSDQKQAKNGEKNDKFSNEPQSLAYRVFIDMYTHQEARTIDSIAASFSPAERSKIYKLLLTAPWVKQAAKGQYCYLPMTSHILSALSKSPLSKKQLAARLGSLDTAILDSLLEELTKDEMIQTDAKGLYSLSPIQTRLQAALRANGKDGIPLHALTKAIAGDGIRQIIGLLEKASFARYQSGRWFYCEPPVDPAQASTLKETQSSWEEKQSESAAKPPKAKFAEENKQATAGPHKEPTANDRAETSGKRSAEANAVARPEASTEAATLESKTLTVLRHQPAGMELKTILAQVPNNEKTKVYQILETSSQIKKQSGRYFHYSLTKQYVETKLEEQLKGNDIKLLGQLTVTAEDYQVLLRYVKEFFSAGIQPRISVNLPLAVALVQIAIRNYGDEKYWYSVTRATSLDISTQKQNYAGKVFLKTLHFHGLFILPQEPGANQQYVENIKAHAFVMDAYLPQFYEFASAFYEKNLFRELSPDIREDYSELSDFMKTTLSSGDDTIIERDEVTKTAKFYRLLKSTRAVFAYADQETIHQIFYPTLQLIDRYFYDSIVPQSPADRYERAFKKWCEKAESMAEKGAGRSHGVRSFIGRRPYLRVAVFRELVSLVIPPMKFRHDACDGTASVIVTINGQTRTRSLELYRSFGMYVSEDLTLDVSDLFGEIEIRIVSLIEKTYRIPGQNYRFFNSSWNSIPKLRQGQNYLLAQKGITVKSQREEDCIESVYNYRNWQYHSFSITDESVIFLDNRPLSIVGEYSPEPVFEEQIDAYKVRDNVGKALLAATGHPQISFLLDSRKLRGTALLVNNKRYPLEVFPERAVFEWPKDKALSAVNVDLSSLLPPEDGRYQIVLDAPAETNKTLCEYLILREFRCKLDKAAYFYDKEAVLHIEGSGHAVTERPDDWTAEPCRSGVQYRIPLNVQHELLSFQIDLQYWVSLPVPMFQYGFSQTELRIDRPDYLWYTDLGETLYLTIPGAKRAHVSYTGLASPIRAFGETISENSFRIDISPIKQQIISDKDRTWHTLTLWFSSEKECELSLPAVLRKLEVRPDIKLRYQDGSVCCNVDAIVGKADAYLTAVETETGSPVLEAFPIAVGQNRISELHRGVLYDLQLFMEESNEFGFLSERTDLAKIQGISCEDWNELVGCRLTVDTIVKDGKTLTLQYDYTVILEEKVGNNQYVGSMFGRKRSHSSVGYRNEEGHISRLGKAFFVLSIEGDTLKASPRLFSYVDEIWHFPYYDVQDQQLLHADDWLLTQSQYLHSRFQKLTNMDTAMILNTDTIRRIKYAVPAV